MLNLSSMEKTKSQTCLRQEGHKSPFTTHYRLKTTDKLRVNHKSKITNLPAAGRSRITLHHPLPTKDYRLKTTDKLRVNYKSQTCVRQAGHESPFTTHYRLPTKDYHLKTIPYSFFEVAAHPINLWDGRTLICSRSDHPRK